MLYSHTKNSSELSILKGLKYNERTKNSTQLINIRQINSDKVSEVEPLIQLVRAQEVEILELKNNLRKKEIVIKQKMQKTRQAQKELEVLRREKESFHKLKTRFENQRSGHIEKMQMLEKEKFQLLCQLNSLTTPKDRYQTCIRELDQLKFNIDSMDKLAKERDFYKFFYDEIKDILVSNQFTAEEICQNLKSLFLECDRQKLHHGTNR